MAIFFAKPGNFPTPRGDFFFWPLITNLTMFLCVIGDFSGHLEAVMKARIVCQPVMGAGKWSKVVKALRAAVNHLGCRQHFSKAQSRIYMLEYINLLH